MRKGELGKEVSTEGELRFCVCFFDCLMYVCTCVCVFTMGKIGLYAMTDTGIMTNKYK